MTMMRRRRRPCRGCSWWATSLDTGRCRGKSRQLAVAMGRTWLGLAFAAPLMQDYDLIVEAPSSGRPSWSAILLLEGQSSLSRLQGH